jgi:fructose-specific PTS system IIA-like component
VAEYTFTCSLPSGVHARPASAIEEVSRPFAADISILNERTGRAANAKSVLGIVGLDIRANDCCRVIVSGDDEHEAIVALERFFEQRFPACDEPLPEVAPTRADLRLPPVLRSAGAVVRAGTAVVPGIGRGRALRIGGFVIPETVPASGAIDAAGELARLDSAIEQLSRRYDRTLDATAPGVEADVLRAHRSVARDPEFSAQIASGVRDRGRTAAGAIGDADAHFAAMLASTGSVILRERALDVRDVCAQLVREIYGNDVASGGAEVHLTTDTICLADTMTPGQLLAIDRRYLKGIVLNQAGTTSHTVILARSFGVPTLVGVSAVDTAGLDGQEVVVDADLGVLVTDLTPAALRYYDMEHRRLEGRRRLRLQQMAAGPAVTADGVRIEIAANIGTAAEAAVAFAGGAEGVGLFRTEMLFVDRDRAPSEDEQFEQYRRVLAEADGRPIIIRTLDVGGDKPIPYLRLPAEDNPFLGYRAVRLYHEFEVLFREQVRALVRASAFGRLKVMIPMVSTLDEVRWCRDVVASEQRRLVDEGVSFDEGMPVGIMVEVPSAAFLLDQLSSELDFFSIGTNDLLQYFAAVDRANARVASLFDPASPAFLRLLKLIVTEVHAHENWVGLCGEMGGQMEYLPLMVGLGLDEISMAAPAIAEARAELGALSAAACRALLDEAVACSTASEVHALLARFRSERPDPLIEPDLVVTRGRGRTKEEAIKEIVDRLYVVGRTDRPRDVEEALWQREAVYSTGFGYGFAIPHCRTDAIRANTLAILKLDTPIEWGSLDGKPVGVLILLAIRESGEARAHMKILAKLARKVVHEDFRDHLAAPGDPADTCRFLEETLDLR